MAESTSTLDAPTPPSSSADIEALRELAGQFLGTFHRSLNGSRLQLPAPWLSFLDSPRWLFGFPIPDVNRCLGITTPTFVAEQIRGVANIPAKMPNAFEIQLHHGHVYQPVPVDQQGRINISECSSTVRGNDDPESLEVVCMGGIRFFAIAKKERLEDLEERFEKAAESAEAWAKQGMEVANQAQVA